jgi:hypothetical protein
MASDLSNLYCKINKTNSIQSIWRAKQARIQGAHGARSPPLPTKKKLTAYHLSTAGNHEAGNPTCGESDAE